MLLQHEKSLAEAHSGHESNKWTKLKFGAVDGTKRKVGDHPAA